MVDICLKLSLETNLPVNKALMNFAKSVGVETIAPAPAGLLKSSSGVWTQLYLNRYDSASLFSGFGLLTPKNVLGSPILDVILFCKLSPYGRPSIFSRM